MHKSGFKLMSKIKDYILVTASYWAFMLTDGALRMLVLLYFHNLGYTPISLAFLFIFYEIFGIFTNLFGGWLAHKYGLKKTLIWGLMIQPAALVGLSFMQTGWPAAVAIPFVMAMQALSGISKDLTKMSSKTAVKFLIPENRNSKLFKWVAILTGSKNAVKGTGFFIGGLLLQILGFKLSLQVMALLIITALISSQLFLKNDIGKSNNNNKLKSIFDQKKEIKILSAARVYLFGARDIWFVVAIPVYLSSAFQWNFTEVGSFMALWVIAYGFIQASAPALLKKWSKGKAPDGKTALYISLLLTLVMLIITTTFLFGYSSKLIMITGLYLFGFVFALNSSVHSFLILDYADGEKAAVNVGFYYMANAMGRLLGTLFSGLLYQWGGVSSALIGSTIFLLITSLISKYLPGVKKN
jgi:MFS family permease